MKTAEDARSNGKAKGETMDDQLDLLDQIAGETRGTDAQDRARKRTVLVALRDHMSNSLQFIAALGPDWQIDYSHYGITDNTHCEWDRQGLRISTGMDTAYMSWYELAEMVEEHPARHSVVGFYRRVPREKSIAFAQHTFALTRPHELSTEPAPHQSWIDDDHQRPGWNDRLEAWRTTITILNDALKETEPHEQR